MCVTCACYVLNVLRVERVVKRECIVCNRLSIAIRSAREEEGRGGKRREEKGRGGKRREERDHKYVRIDSVPWEDDGEDNEEDDGEETGEETGEDSKGGEENLEGKRREEEDRGGETRGKEGRGG